MIPLSKPNISEETLEAVREVFLSGWWTMGKITQQLEEEFAEYVEAKYAVATSSCSAALHLAVRAVSQDCYSFVATTPFIFCSTINSLIHNGLIPLWVDVDRRTQCIDLKQISKHKAYFQGLLIVHFAGYPCDMDTVMELKEKNGLWLIEDCAHAVETKWKGKHAGTFGDVGCFSFNPTKNIAAPEMGMLVTDNQEIADKIRRWRIHGMSASALERVTKPGKYDIIDLGYKYNCTDVEAVVALHQLRNISENYWRRRNICFIYNSVLIDLRNAGFFNGFLPVLGNDYETKTAHHLYTIQIPNRDKFIQEMLKRDICCGIHYKPVSLHSYYASYYVRNLICPNAEWLGDHTVSLPLGPGMEGEDLDTVMNALEEVFRTGEYLFREGKAL